MNLKNAPRRSRPRTKKIIASGNLGLPAVLALGKPENKYFQVVLTTMICFAVASPLALAREAKAYSFRISLDNLAGKVGLNSGQEPSFPSVIGSIIYGALALLGVVSLLIIIIAGYKWMMAGGNEETVSSARAMIKNAVIGVIIALGAYAITYFVISKLI